MLPHAARLAAHEVERAGRGIERKSLPCLAFPFPEAELAGRCQREAEDQTEIGLVAMPTDAGTWLILREENVLNCAYGQVRECLDLCHHRDDPGGERRGGMQALIGEIIAPAE